MRAASPRLPASRRNRERRDHQRHRRALRARHAGGRGAATLAGGKALGRPDLGRLEAGAKADLLVFDLHKPHLQPVWDPIKNLVRKGNGGDMAFAMVHGKPVFRDRRLLTMDEDAVMSTAAGAAHKIWKAAGERGILPPSPA